MNARDANNFVFVMVIQDFGVEIIEEMVNFPDDTIKFANMLNEENSRLLLNYLLENRNRFSAVTLSKIFKMIEVDINRDFVSLLEYGSALKLFMDVTDEGEKRNYTISFNISELRNIKLKNV